ncbi:MAG: GGDEF domain-containing protein [Planctomycetota bacterium]
MEQTGPKFSRAWLGTAPELLELRTALDSISHEVRELPPERPWELPEEGDLVLVSSSSSAYNAFPLCLRLKARPGITVILVYPEEDAELIVPLAQFCMVDGFLILDPKRKLDGHERLELLLSVLHRRTPEVSADELLERLERQVGPDAADLANRVLVGLSADKKMSFIESVTDAEIGLFNGEFMAFKLEEEFKRSQRFRYPLSVLLMDLPGVFGLGEKRTALIGQLAGVFLNQSRDIDSVGSYGETSFLMLLPNTGSMGSTVLATRILKTLRAELVDPLPEEPAIAIVTVPKSGIEHKDHLLDLARLTLMKAWAARGEGRVQVAG